MTYLLNSYGLALTGNELTPTDNRPGVPRSIIAKAILGARNLSEAKKIATDPSRASSYNNIVSDQNDTVDIEGSATAYELVYARDGLLVHTNHYLCSDMKRFEGYPNYTSSLSRQARAEERVAQHKGPVGQDELEQILKDHAGSRGGDNTICRHGPKSRTVFSLVIDFGDRVVDLAMGNPCQNLYERVWQIP